jgi:hypothetical protein
LEWENESGHKTIIDVILMDLARNTTSIQVVVMADAPESEESLDNAAHRLLSLLKERILALAGSQAKVEKIKGQAQPPASEQTSERRQVDATLNFLIVLGAGLLVALGVYMPLFFCTSLMSRGSVTLMLLVQISFLVPLLGAGYKPVSSANEHRRRFADEQQRCGMSVASIRRNYDSELKRYQAELARNRTQSLAELQNMHHSDFEKHVAYIFHKMGYHTSILGGTGDGGVDVEAKSPTEHAIIQCKRYGPNTRVGSPDIRNFVGAMSITGVNKGYFVTSGKFSKPAVKEANRVESLVLIDGTTIVSLWKELKIGPYREAKPPTPPKYPQPPEYTPPPPYPAIRVFRFTVGQWLALMALAEINLAVIILLFMLM